MLVSSTLEDSKNIEVVYSEEQPEPPANIDNLSPTQYADFLGLAYTAKVTSEHKRGLGQFFTPIEIANFLSSFVVVKRKKIKILDPGCGTAILACALAEHILANFQGIKEIDLTAFECDLSLIPYAEKSLQNLQKWLNERNVNLNYILGFNDFILHNSSLLNTQNKIEEKFDVVITNPPYFKIPKSDSRAIAAKSIIHGQTNIYTIFIIISAKLLYPNGQLVFITPRSFTSGNYFKLFRHIFFSLIEFKAIHLFNSRRVAFERDKVLQENVIVYCKRKPNSPSNSKTKIAGKKHSSLVKISTSTGVSDLQTRQSKNFEFSELVNMSTSQKILHLPSSLSDEKAIKIFKSWKGNLSSYGIEISTGPVVDFRSLEFINEVNGGNNYVPLIWLNNVKKMEFIWPIIEKPKGKVKGQYIQLNKESKSRLIPNKNYVFLRRFSAKDDQSRLTASHYFYRWLPKYSHIGVENHLNYIYRKGKQLKRLEVLGIAALLNSKLFDIYFRTFNGNINVSATELREMPFPSLNQIESIGKLVDKSKINRSIIDTIVESIFKINLSE